MLDALEIRKEIARLEYEEASYDNYAKLATLYTIRAEMSKPETEEHTARVTPARSYSVETVDEYGDSDFLHAIAGKPPGAVWLIIDELVDSLRVMQPRTYAAVMRKISAL